VVFSPPASLRTLTGRYDPAIFELRRPRARIRLDGAGPRPLDAVLEGDKATLEPADLDERPDALLSADEQTWEAIANDVRGGMTAFRAGRLRIRHDLHLGVGFLAATAASGDGGLRFRHIETRIGELSICEAGTGPPAVLIHGLGATKVSFLPTLNALADSHRPIAVDLPGFGDSTKPIRGAYDAPYFASAITALLDALEIERADIVGNSMGGRVAIELGLRYPERVRRLALLAPSLAWRRSRPWAPYLRFVAPQLGLIQPAPRPLVETIVRHLVPTSDREWTAVGIDEFLRSYLTPRGRAAFYAAARNIYLEEPFGSDGFWTRLPSLQADTLFVWGRKDQLVPIAFEQHVREALPRAAHIELDCGHVPQLERPRETHDAVRRFLGSQWRFDGPRRPRD
jgi:pimeloyl-ACP methyl ester carboxylesterase